MLLLIDGYPKNPRVKKCGSLIHSGFSPLKGHHAWQEACQIPPPGMKAVRHNTGASKTGSACNKGLTGSHSGACSKSESCAV